MHSNVVYYRVTMVLLSIASAGCLLEHVDGRFVATRATYLSAMYPSLICMAFWIWWQHPVFRLGGYCVASLLLWFSATALMDESGGGDMDFGPQFTISLATAGCVTLSVIWYVLAGLLLLIWPAARSSQKTDFSGDLERQGVVKPLPPKSVHDVTSDPAIRRDPPR
jgi:hypothetical protein